MLNLYFGLQGFGVLGLLENMPTHVVNIHVTSRFRRPVWVHTTLVYHYLFYYFLWCLKIVQHCSKINIFSFLWLLQYIWALGSSEAVPTGLSKMRCWWPAWVQTTFWGFSIKIVTIMVNDRKVLWIHAGRQNHFLKRLSSYEVSNLWSSDTY